MSKLNIYNYGSKILAFATGVALAVMSPAAVKASTNFNVLNDTEISTNISNNNIMNINDFKNVCESAKAELQFKLGKMYDGIGTDIACLVYLTNIEYIYGTELEEQLIDSGIIKRVNLTMVEDNGAFERLDKDGWFVNDNARKLINEINGYNDERMIGDIGGPLAIDNIENLIDLSVFMYNEHDKDETKVNMGNLENFGTALATYYDSEDEISNEFNRNVQITETATISHRAITSLNSDSINNNTSNLSMGSRWLNKKTYGKTMMRYIAFYLDEIASRKTLGNYFVIAKLNKSTFEIREDEAIAYDLIEDPMLRDMIEKYAELEITVLDTANNDLYKLLGYNCISKGETYSKSR